MLNRVLQFLAFSVANDHFAGVEQTFFETVLFFDGLERMLQARQRARLRLAIHLFGFFAVIAMVARNAIFFATMLARIVFAFGIGSGLKARSLPIFGMIALHYIEGDYISVAFGVLRILIKVI